MRCAALPDPTLETGRATRWLPRAAPRLMSFRYPPRRRAHTPTFLKSPRVHRQPHSRNFSEVLCPNRKDVVVKVVPRAMQRSPASIQIHTVAKKHERTGLNVQERSKSSDTIMGFALPSALPAPTTFVAAAPLPTHSAELTVGANSCVYSTSH